jgi:hypothetical protein
VESAPWLARLRHDLVKRLVWPARDRRDLGGSPAPGELVVTLVDDEGAPMTPHDLWRALAAEAPRTAAGGSVHDEAILRFEAALTGAVSAGAAGDVDGVLALESAFEALARSLEGE